MASWTTLFVLLFVLPAVVPAVAGGVHLYRSIRTQQYAEWEQVLLGGVTAAGGLGSIVAPSSIAGTVLGLLACGGFSVWLLARALRQSDVV